MRTMDETVEQLYASISFNKGEKPNFQLLKELFIHGGRLIDNNGDQPQIYTLDGFIDAYKKKLEEGAFESVFEVEIAHKTDVFGKIAQRFSSYEFRFNPNDEKPYTTGINSIQMILIGSKWTVTSMVWNDENPGLKIPEIYLLM